MKLFTTFVFVLILVFTPYIRTSAHILYWFTGAAVKKPTEVIAKMFNKTHKDRVVVIAGGTGQVLQQMILSKKGDIYGCMDPKFFHLAKSKGLVVRYTKFLELTPVFGVSNEALYKVTTFYDLFKKDVKIAAGNPKTMALGKTYMYLLSKLPKKLKEEMERNVVIKALNISQIISYIKMNVVDAGIMFEATAKVNHIKYINIPQKYNRIKTAYLAEMIFGTHKKAKDELYNFILNHVYVFKQYGYKVLIK